MQFDAEATVRALETRVAVLESTNESLQQALSLTPEPVTTETPLPSWSTVNLAGWTIKYGTTVRTEAIESNDPMSAAGVFLVVMVTIQNQGLEAVEFPYRDLMVVDSRDRRFTADDDATFAYWTASTDFRYPDDPLQPSIDYRYAIVFDVAPASSGFTLTSSENVFEIDLRI